MAERVRHFPLPEYRLRYEMSQEDIDRIGRRRQALDLLRKQAEIAQHRLKMDIFHVWRTGGGSQEQIAKASGYTRAWVSMLIDSIKEDPEKLEEAIREWIKDNPGKPLNGRFDDE